MKNLLLTISISVFSLLILSFTITNDKTTVPIKGGDVTFNIPADVEPIINDLCYGCHNSESSSTKGKMKLNFDKMPDMKTGKLVGKLGKISKTITKGNMPPKKFLTKNPDKKLTKDEAQKLITWADEMARKISGE